MSQTGGKRKANKSLKAWVKFIKKVQREEKLSYKDAMKRAKQRKDKGEKWMIGGNDNENMLIEEETEVMPSENTIISEEDTITDMNMNGGRSHRRTRGRSHRRTRGRSHRRTRSRGRGRTARRA
jgi:hypothetical protein